MKFPDSGAIRLGYMGSNHYVSLLPARTEVTSTASSTKFQHSEQEKESNTSDTKLCNKATTLHKDMLMKRKSEYPWLITSEDGALCSACSVYYANRPIPKGTKGVFITAAHGVGYFTVQKV